MYLYQNIFEDNNEHFKWLIKGLIFTDSTNADPSAPLQPAIFVMSTTKWYVLNVIGDENENITKWLKREMFGTINRVEMVRVLPWKVGITFSIKYVGKIHFLLQDIARTDSLLLFFASESHILCDFCKAPEGVTNVLLFFFFVADNPLPIYCDLEYQISERISQKLLQVTKNTQLKMFTILNYCNIIEDDESTLIYEHASFITTDSHLYLTKSKYDWLMDESDRGVEVARSQEMTDLIELDTVDEKTFMITFLDEIHDQRHVWHCSFETASCLQNTLAAISQSWEKLFKVPLINANN